MGRAESLARLQAVTAYNQQKDKETQEFAAQAREQVDRAAQMTFSGVGSGAEISPTPTTKRWPSLMERATNRERIYNDMKDEPIYMSNSYLAEQMRKNANAGASDFVGIQNWDHLKPAQPTERLSAVDWLGSKAADFNKGITAGLDMVANALPTVEGKIFGVEPEATFTGQVLKPVTDATGKLHDWVTRTDAALDQKVDTAVGDNPVARIASDVGGGVITALPNFVLAMLSGGASVPAQLGAQGGGLMASASTALQAMAKNPMYWTSVAQSVGPAYEEALDNGATEDEAMLTAVISSGLGSMVEAGGGIEALPGNLVDAAGDTSRVLQWVKSALEEGLEEPVQGVLERLTNKAVYDTDRKMFSVTDPNAVFNPLTMAQEAAMGAAVGGILGGGPVLVDAVLNRPKAQTQTAPDVQQPQAAPATVSKNATVQQAVDTDRAAVDQAAQMTFGQNKTAPAVEADADSTNVDTDPTHHTPQEQAVIDAYQGSVDQNLVDYYDGVEKGNEKGFYPLKPVSDRAASDIHRITGNNVTGFNTRFDARQMFHIKNDHGVNGKANQSMADSNDVGRIQFVLDNYDNVEPGGTTDAYWETKENGHNRRATTVVFSKKVNGTYYVVEAAPVTKAKSLYVVSAYMENGAKNKGASSHLLDAEAPRTRPIPPNANNAPANSIPEKAETVNGSVGDMGAKTSAFPHEVKQSQTATNTIGKNEDRWNVPEDARVDASYDAVTEQESLNNARMRLEQDAAGEMEHLRNSSAWNGEDVDVGMLILGGLRQKAKENGDWNQFKEWAKVVKQHGVTAGQALQAWAKYTRMTADGVMNIVAQNLENARKGTDVDAVLQLTSEMADKFEALNTAKDIDGLVQMIKDTSNVRRTGTFFGNKISKQMNWALNHVAEMARQDPDGKAYEFLRNFAAAGIEDIAGDHTKVSAGKVIKTVRYNAMLSKTATVLRNLVGNGVMDVTDTFARDISVPLDMLLSKITGTRSVAVDKSWISEAKRKGSIDSLAMALMESGLDVNASGAANRYEQTANRTAKMSGGVMERLLSSMEKWSAYNLTVTDEVAKGGTAAEVQRGIDKLYEQGKIRDDSLRNGGQQEALYRTFQDDTKLSKATGKVRDALNTFGMEDFGAGDFAMPFSKVPSNLPMRAFDYSPAGAARGMVQLVDVLIKAKKGTLTAAEQAKAVQSIGRGVTGSMAIWGLTALAKAGLIHVMSPGGTEENKDKETQEKNQGLSGTQFNLSAAKRLMQGGSAEWQEGDQLLSIGFLEPFNAHMAIAALIAEDEDATLGQIAGATFSGLLQSISELPVMDVIADAVNAFRYSDGDNLWEKTVDAGTTYLAGQATSFIPNALKGVAQGLDPAQRDLYTADTVGGQLLDNVKARIPGLRNTLPEKLDSYGRPMENEGGVKNFLNATVNPGAVTTYHEDEVEAATRMLAEDTGRTSVYAERKPPNHLTVGGEQIQLDVDQRRGYQQTRGQTEHETKAALNADDTFTGLDRGLQADAFETAETYSKEVAKSGLGLGYEPPKWVRDLEGKSQEEVIDAIIQKTLENADGYGDADLAAALSMTVEDGLSPDLARESAVQAQAYADAVYRYELGYADVPDWVETAMQMTTDQQREKYLAAVAAGNYAEATYGKKYDGLEQMLSEGQITDEVALLACSNSVQTAYRDACKGKGISAEQFIDVYGHAYSNGESAQERREAGLKYIEGLNVSSTTRAAMAKGLYEAIMEYIPKGSKLPTDWLLDNDADGMVYDQLTENQQIAYNTYIRGSGLEMADYIDVKGFKDVDGHNRDLVIGYIEANYQSREQRRALYLAMGYSSKTIPW